MRKMKMK